MIERGDAHTTSSVMTSAAVALARSLAIVFACSTAVRCAALIQTTRTTYQYNADGAPSAVTTQVDNQAPTTVYLTWDNFVPSTGDPTSGTVRAGNGNLSGFGATPGSAYATQFKYDQRNRLVGAIGTQSVAYTYNSGSMMASSTLADSDTLQFYYNTALDEQVTNINKPSTATWSSYLGATTYLSDGSEQMRCTPRKDMAGVYEAATQTFSPVRYDPYGATVAGGTSSADAAIYDLRHNPFLYAGEYQDPTWGGYYLRARWYLPAYQTFLERDRGDAMHHYSYSSGGPIGRVDPSGMRSVVESGARTFLRDLHADNNGVRGSLSRFFLGGIIGVTQILASPSGYWHELVRNSHDLTIFLALGVFAEVGTSGLGPFFDPGANALGFAAHHVIDLEIGTGQALASARGKHGRFDWASFGQGMEYTVGGIFWGREMVGVGYKPYGLTADDVTDMARRHFADGTHPNDMLVFRSRSDKGFWAGTSPIKEGLKVGSYHEAVVAVGPDWTLTTEVTTDDDGDRAKEATRWKPRGDKGAVSYIKGKQMVFVGVYSAEDVQRAIVPPDYLKGENSVYLNNDSGTFEVTRNAHNGLVNNCHRYAAHVIGRLGH